MGKVYPMIEMRLAQSGEVVRQKEIWKRCFGDSDSFIDFYYENRYKAEDTVVLINRGQISAMLTLIPIRVVTPGGQSHDAAMLYAIATHPDDQHRGFASQIINFSNQFLGQPYKKLSVLVPAEEPLFDFYRKLGYQDGFFIREALLKDEEINHFDLRNLSPSSSCGISPVTPEIYNQTRDRLLRGNLYVAYDNNEIAYQKKLSQMSGADIYTLYCGELQGCAAIERVSPNKVLIKEILFSDELLPTVLKKIALLLPAKEYIVRTPLYLGEGLGGAPRPFGMFKLNQQHEVNIIHGYLGLAFD